MEWKQARQMPPGASGSEALIRPDAEPPNSGLRGTARVFNRPVFAWVLAGLMLAVVIGLLMARFPDTRAETKRLDALEKKLEQLEAQTGRIPALAEDMARLSEKTDALAHALNLATGRLNHLDAGLTGLKKTTAALAHAAAAPRAAPAARRGALHTVYHRIRPGETLYSISRRYGTTVERLRHDNRLGRRQLIHPGQLLKIRR